MNKLKTLFLPLLLVARAFAQQDTLKVDPQSSEVAFSLGDVLHSVKGTFHVQSGTIQVDQSASKMSGTILVAAGSGKSGNGTRDRKMANEVLDATHFADITFTPRTYQGTIAPTGDSTIQVTGALTLHGAPHDLTVPMQIHIEGTNCTAKTRFAIPYVKWGLKDPSTFILRVGKEVEIELSLAGTISRAN